VRTVLGGSRIITINTAFVHRLKRAGLYSERLLKTVAATESIQGFNAIPEPIRRVFVTAHDISPERHVRMQAAFQKYSDSGVSKTINLPTQATKADVAGALRLAYQLGCKGMTVYRSGSRENQVMACSNTQYC